MRGGQPENIAVSARRSARHADDCHRCDRIRVSRAVDRDGAWNLPRVNQCHWWDVFKGDYPMSIISTRTGSAAPSAARRSESETSSDEMLIRRIAGGDQLAMRTLFCRHRVALYRWLLRLVRDEALAEDLLSDVFLDVWRQAASFEATLFGFDLAAGDCALQGAFGASPPSGYGTRRDDRIDGGGSGGRSRGRPAEEGSLANACAIPWSGYPPSTARSSTWSIITANRSRTPPRSSASARPQRRPACFTRAGNWPTWSRRPSASPARGRCRVAGSARICLFRYRPAR